MNKILYKIGFMFFYISVVIGLIYILCGGRLFDEVLTQTLYGYSILLFIACFIISLILIYKSEIIPPSIFLLPFFLAGPIIGPTNLRLFIEDHGNFFGRSLPSFAFPTFVWAVGTICFFLGVLLSHLIVQRPKQNFLILWDSKRISFCLWFTVGLTTIFSIIAIYKIGYIPLLTSNIIEERINYDDIVGRYVMKFSQLWLAVGSLSSMLFFLKQYKKLYLLITLLCVVGVSLYGQRTGAFLVICIFGLMFDKFRKLKISYLAIAGFLIIVITFVFIFWADFRGGYQSRSIRDLVAGNFFSEWNYYATVVTEAKQNSDYLKGKIFLGQIATLLPRQVFALFGDDKERIIKEYSAVYYYGEEFEEPYGIRITPIGEAFAGYGMIGVIIQLLLIGIYFGFLEKIYLGLKKQDTRLCLVCFLISLAMYLPIGMIYMILTPITQEGLFIILYLFLGAKRCMVQSSQNSEIKILQR